MNSEQEFTPKYWVGHNKRTDDVFLKTARKAKFDSEVQMRWRFGDSWDCDDSELEVVLVEIKLIEGKGNE